MPVSDTQEGVNGPSHVPESLEGDTPQDSFRGSTTTLGLYQRDPIGQTRSLIAGALSVIILALSPISLSDVVHHCMPFMLCCPTPDISRDKESRTVGCPHQYAVSPFYNETCRLIAAIYYRHVSKHRLQEGVARSWGRISQSLSLQISTPAAQAWWYCVFGQCCQVPTTELRLCTAVIPRPEIYRSAELSDSSRKLSVVNVSATCGSGIKPPETSVNLAERSFGVDGRRLPTIP